MLKRECKTVITILLRVVLVTAAALSATCRIASADVIINSPLNNATSGQQVLVNAASTESSSQIDHVEVWDDSTGQKIAQSGSGATSINQSVPLAPGQHRLIVQDVATGTYQVRSQSSVTFTVCSGCAGPNSAITINAPLQNSTSGPQVLVNASATASNAQIDHIEVWDTASGQKLGDSPSGTSSINQSFTVAPGQHQLVVQDVGTGNFRVLNQAVVNVVVSSGQGLTIIAPQNNSNQNNSVFVSASVDSARPIDHIEVWDTTYGNKLGDAAGAKVQTSYTLPQNGTHNILIQAISSGDFQVAAKGQALVNVTGGGGGGGTSGVTISSPANGATVSNDVWISVQAKNNGSFDHLNIVDNGTLLATVRQSSLGRMFYLPNGGHNLVITSVDSSGNQASSQISYNVANSCNSGAHVFCNFLDASSPWVPDTGAAQGPGSSQPSVYGFQPYGGASNPLPNNDFTLDGKSIKFYERDTNYANVLFGQKAPVSWRNTSNEEDYWTLDEHINLYNPTATEAFETDAQYVWNGAWTMFYTECDLDGGHWNVYGGGNGWQPLDGKTRDANGNIPPVLTCSRDGRDAMGNGLQGGWHHIVWRFKRSPQGFAIFHSLSFDDKPEVILDYAPTTYHRTVSGDQGDFGVLIQLGGVSTGVFNNNPGISRDLGVFVDKLTLTHGNSF